MTKIEGRDYFEYLETWQKGLPNLSLKKELSHPETWAVVSVDIINGFCYEGPLANPRVAGIVEPIRNLFERVWANGVRNIVLIQDTHEPDAIEFSSFPAHCVRGTHESETVDAFKKLSFFDQTTILPKNSIAAGLDTGLNEWVSSHPAVSRFIIVGDCTDLCTYQLAMHLRLDANARQMERRVVVPADCVETYDLPVDTALKADIFPHPGDLLHLVFLNHMALNGVEVVGRVSD